MTDDRVTGIPADAEPVSWREVEVEGDPETIDETEKPLRAAGFRRSSAPSKLARVLDTRRPDQTSPDRGARAGQAVLAYVTTQVDRIKHYDILVRQDVDDSVHQLRVAARRLRSALRVYEEVLPTGDLDGELRWLGQRLGPARDLEVQEERIRTAVAALPGELVVGPVEARITRHFAPEQQKARRIVLQTLRGKRYLKLLDRLEKLLAEPPLTGKAGKRARKQLPKDLSRAHRKVAKRLDAGEVHRARKAAKRVRYGFEVAGPVLGEPADDARRKAKAFTKLGGEYQDSVISLPILRELGMQAHGAGENGFTFGLLHAQAAATAQQAVRALTWS